MTPREQQEYTELRATIRQRGTGRVCVFVAGIATWAAIMVASLALSAQPIATLAPLLLLTATFEAVFALHVGVERVGRYLAVFYDDGWERAVAAFGQPPGALAIDALFTVVFGLAALLNLVPALLARPTAEELIFVGGAHALFVVRVVFARLAASKQREVDTQRFRQIKATQDKSG